MPHASDPELVEARQLILALQFCGKSNARSLLDVGCGDGSFTREYSGRLPCRMFGIDPSLADLQKTCIGKGKPEARVTFAAASGEALPFADGAFEVAALTSSL